MARLKSVPLIERRAQVAALADAEKRHLESCSRGNSCKELQEIREELRAGRAELRGWFAPTDYQPSLFSAVSPLGIDTKAGKLLDNATGRQVGQIRMIAGDGQAEEWEAWLWKVAGQYPTDHGGACEAIARRGDVGKLATALVKRGVWWS